MKKDALIFVILTAATMNAWGAPAATRVAPPLTLVSMCSNADITFIYSAPQLNTESFRCDIKNGAIQVTAHTRSTLEIPEFLLDGEKPSATVTLPNDAAKLENIFKHGTGMTMVVSSATNPSDAGRTYHWGRNNKWTFTMPDLFDTTVAENNVDPNSPAYLAAAAQFRTQGDAFNQHQAQQQATYVALAARIGPTLAAQAVTSNDPAVLQQIESLLAQPAVKSKAKVKKVQATAKKPAAKVTAPASTEVDPWDVRQEISSVR